ncbi:MAG: sugar isomerase domain-containing protein [Bifidobacteriaceae bacterium]|nr:sugar isomerase domain-containing protein [Bifidobacteriaceae bacterium]
MTHVRPAVARPPLAAPNGACLAAGFEDFSRQIAARLAKIDQAFNSGRLDDAIDLMVRALDDGGIIQAFGSGHSQSFAMEIAGRAGGLVPTHAMKLSDLVVAGLREPRLLEDPNFERDPRVADELYELYEIHPADLFVIASNSGANGAVVGLALRAKAEGHAVIAVTSLAHTRRATPNHPSSKRLSEVADIAIDNLAPYGDAAVDLGGSVKAGAVSSITAAYIAQLLTIGAATRFLGRGDQPPLYISVNTARGLASVQALQEPLGARIRPFSVPRPADVE